MAILGFNFNLEDQLTFYGSYHHNFYNQLIHMLFVPVIMWSTVVWLVPLSLPFSSDLLIKYDLVPADGFHWGLIVAAAYMLYYIKLSGSVGLSFSFVIYLLYRGATSFYYGVDSSVLYATIIHFFGWFMQIYPGHVLLEGRKPALLDSFFQSLVLAPLFVWYELLFMLGLQKELKQRINKRVIANIRAWKKQSAQ